MLANISQIFKKLYLYIAIWVEDFKRAGRKYDLVDVGFGSILLASLSALLFMISEISISGKEINALLSARDSHLFSFVALCLEIFGSNDYALRGSFLALHCVNMLLMYNLSRLYLKKPSDSLLLMALYALLPATNLSAILLYKSGFILFALLLICYFQMRFSRPPYISIFVFGLLDLAFSAVFVALCAFAIKKRKTKTFIASILGFGINMFLYEESIGGIPKAYCLDLLGSIAMLFSPFLFLYYVYTLYAAVARRKEDSLMVYIATSGLILMLLLSLRQKVDITQFTPLLLVGFPVLAFGFFSDIRLRLKQFKRRFRIRMSFIIATLLLETILLFGNKITYIFSSKPNFAYPYYVAKDLANELKSHNILAIKTQDSSLALRLGFYGVGMGSGACLYEKKPKGYRSEKISIEYFGVSVASYFLVRHSGCRV